MFKRFSGIWLVVLLLILSAGCLEYISPRHSFKLPIISGNLPADTFGFVDFEAYVRNGRIQFETDTTLGRGFSIDIVLHVRAESREKAELIMQDAVHYDAFGRIIKLRIDKEKVGAKVTVRVPQSYTYNLDLKTSNGGISLDGLNCNDSLLQSSNGTIKIKDVNGRTVEGITSNGRIQFIDSRADKITLVTSNGTIEFLGEGRNTSLRTSNGKIVLSLLPSDYINFFPRAQIVAQTSNGAINVKLPEERGAGYNLKASTSNGRVKILMRGFEVIDEGQWRTLAFDSCTRQIDLFLTTSNANINIERFR